MKESPSPGSLVRELHVASDYGQIYIYDPETQQEEWADVYDEESSTIFRAMDDASESRRFVGYAEGMVDVLTPSQYSWKAPMRVEVSDAPPPARERPQLVALRSCTRATGCNDGAAWANGNELQVTGP